MFYTELPDDRQVRSITPVSAIWAALCYITGLHFCQLL